NRNLCQLEKVGRKSNFTATLRLGLKPRNAGSHGPASLADFTEFRGKFDIIDSYQRLSLLDDGSLLDQNLVDDPALKRLHDLGQARWNNAAIATFHLIEHCEMRPCQRRKEQRR